VATQFFLLFNISWFASSLDASRNDEISTNRHYRGRLAVQLLIIITIFYSTIAHANPWLPKPGGWKYNLQYSKYIAPKSIKSVERNGYFALEGAKKSLYQDLEKFTSDFTPHFQRVQTELLMREGIRLMALSYNEKQIVRDRLFAQDPALHEYYNRIQNKKTDIGNKINQIKMVQDALIVSYHKWSATTDIEYGLSENISYGVGIGRDRGVEKFQTNKKTDRFSIFFKTRLYENKKYIFTLQPKFLTLGPLQGADLSIILGKSHKIKRKIFGKKAETFFYSSFGATRFLNSNIMRNQLHTEVTSGIKWNDGTILMNQESEDFNLEMSKNYKNILRSQFTIAQDLNVASIEPRNKVYLALSYFMIDSLAARRRLSSGYSIGLWLEF